MASLGPIPKLKLFWKGTLISVSDGVLGFLGQFFSLGLLLTTRFGGACAEKRKFQ